MLRESQRQPIRLTGVEGLLHILQLTLLGRQQRFGKTQIIQCGAVISHCPFGGIDGLRLRRVDARGYLRATCAGFCNRSLILIEERQADAGKRQPNLCAPASKV